ncbi:MAG: AmmeMemoRadiSam system protein A [Acidobacteria bacterium]|nr:AmmeMemoRadiSam system protein A [Acidobacteriota bacterium]MCI0720058.1 AmmeMemoRadiSam system protein A [Acidobacteriota bacterium]
MSLSLEEQGRLLALARQALTAAVEHTSLDLGGWSAERASEILTRPGFAFVTLYQGGRLRGCVGSLHPEKPLYLAVADSAVSAALQDPRFPPVAPNELPGLRLEVSILSPFFVVQPEEVVPGEHGLFISQGFQRGLLLPKVAAEHGWDRERFLAETCLKAGLEPSAWKKGARLEAFTAVSFAED